MVYQQDYSNNIFTPLSSLLLYLPLLEMPFPLQLKGPFTNSPAPTPLPANPRLPSTYSRFSALTTQQPGSLKNYIDAATPSRSNKSELGVEVGAGTDHFEAPR